jgi:hypothetical protein
MFEESDITPCSPVGVSEKHIASIFKVDKYANQHEEGSSKKGEKFPFIIVSTPPEDGNKYLIIY